MTVRLRGPELHGRGGWLNSRGAEPRLADLRGRVVLLDFWTGACVNCLHTLAELRLLEQRFGADLVVLGIHSPKFPFEADHATVAAAVDRNQVGHPVLDDADLRTWQAYTVRAWPTLVLLDPAGYIAATWTGEGHTDEVTAAVTDLLARRTGPAPGPLPWSLGAEHDLAAPPAPVGGLRYPARAIRLAGGQLLVADTAQHSLVELTADGARQLRRIGVGSRGLVDGGPGVARFADPQGLAELPSAVAAAVGYDVVVADTANHTLRGLRLADGSVRTLAGPGPSWTDAEPTGMSSPWDVAWWRDRAWVAMAGIHQLWTFDPVSGHVAVAGGTRREGLGDGPLAVAEFAQTSALAADPVRDVLWLVDPESSALRVVSDGPAGLTVRTIAGQGLFAFGHRDGRAADALFQHPLGVRVDQDGAVVIADTYNGAIRRYDPGTDLVRTVATGLAEPSDVVPGADSSTLLVVEAAASRLREVPVLPVDVDPAVGPTDAQRTALAPGRVELVVAFRLPAGEQLDESVGPATRLVVTATPPALLRAGAGPGTGLTRVLDLDAAVGDGVLHVSARAASCDVAGSGSPHAACHLHRQEWELPVVLDPAGSAVLTRQFGGAG